MAKQFAVRKRTIPKRFSNYPDGDWEVYHVESGQQVDWFNSKSEADKEVTRRQARHKDMYPKRSRNHHPRVGLSMREFDVIERQVADSVDHGYKDFDHWLAKHPNEWAKMMPEQTAQLRRVFNEAAWAAKGGQRNPGQLRKPQLYILTHYRTFYDTDPPMSHKGTTKIMPAGTEVLVLGWQKSKHGDRAYAKAFYEGTTWFGWVDKELLEKPGSESRMANPEPAAADLFRSFHGSEPTSVLEYRDEVHEHEWYAGLGDLIELKVRTVTGYDAEIKFEVDESGGDVQSNPRKIHLSSYDTIDGFAYSRAMTRQVEDECGASGRVDDAVEYWRKKLGLTVDHDAAVSWLKETGGWSKSELEETDDDTLAERVLWISASNAKENRREHERERNPRRRRRNSGETDVLSSAADSLSTTVKLCSNEAGTQLYFVGGDQNIDEVLRKVKMTGAKWEKESMCIGVLYEATYQTRKHFHKFKLTDYWHSLGEETGNQPMLNYDFINKSMTVAGGTYHITPRGIED